MLPIAYFILTGVTLFIGAAFIAGAVLLRRPPRSPTLRHDLGDRRLRSDAHLQHPRADGALRRHLGCFPALACRRKPPPAAPSWRLSLRVTVVAAILLQTAIELPRQLPPNIPPRSFDRLVVIGDSISAGYRTADNAVWPQFVADHARARLLNLARAGSTMPAALEQQASTLDDTPCLLVLEIGGNDMLSGHPPERFQADLDRLLTKVCRSDRTVLLFELPTFPFQSVYAQIQRRLAGAHDVILIPRRYLISIIREPENTADGVHLTPTGHRRMAAMVEGLLGSAWSHRDSRSCSTKCIR